MKKQLFKTEKVLSNLMFLCMVLFIKFIIIDIYSIPSGSMEPTLKVGDRVLVNQMAYSIRIPNTENHLVRYDTPQKGDVVVFYEHETGLRYIKRIMATEGDTVTLKGDTFFVNGKPLQKDKSSNPEQNKDYDYYVEHNNGKSYTVKYIHNYTRWFDYISQYKKGDFTGYEGVKERRLGSWVVPKGKLLMIGDNRDNSKDSRFLKQPYIDIDQVLGKAIAVPFRFNQISSDSVLSYPSLASGNTSLY